MAAEMELCDDKDLETLPSKLSASLSQHLKSKNAQISKVKNQFGGYKRGIYKLKKVREIKPKQIEIKLKPEILPKVSALYTGCAGEHAVLSELLIRGYNSSLMTVDEGIDIVASKGNRYFHIQTKTSAGDEQKRTFTYTIKKSVFDLHDQALTFYIFVMYRLLLDRIVCDYAILQSSYISRLRHKGHISDKDSISVRITIENNGKFLLNKKEDITFTINKFSQIK